MAGKRATAAQEELDAQIARMLRTVRRQRIALLLIALMWAGLEITTLYPALH
jgi:hypothetical protein